MSCFNCKTKKKFNEIIVLDKKTKEGICFICYESLDINTINIKVLIHIQEESSSKLGNKCIFCNKKTSQIPNTCSIHFCCYDCVIDPDAFMSNFHEDLSKCFNWMKLALMQCKSCFQELNVDDRFYVFTCNSHFYCKNCILSKRFYCKICLGVDEIPKTKNKYLTRILLKVKTLKVLLHDNHISNYEIFYASDINSGINCERCKTIILEIRKLIELKSIKACNVSDCGFMILEPIISLSNASNNLQNFDVHYNRPLVSLQEDSFPSYNQDPNYLHQKNQNFYNQNQLIGDYSNQNVQNPNLTNYNQSNTEFAYQNQLNPGLNYQNQPIPYSHYPKALNNLNELNPRLIRQNLPIPNISNQLQPNYINNQNLQALNIIANQDIPKQRNFTNDETKMHNQNITETSVQRRKNEICSKHNRPRLNLPCKHHICDECVLQIFQTDFFYFCTAYINKRLENNPRRFCIRCPHENCDSRYLYSCDYFEIYINEIFRQFNIDPRYYECFKLYFEGSQNAFYAIGNIS